MAVDRKADVGREIDRLVVECEELRLESDYPPLQARLTTAMQKLGGARANLEDQHFDEVDQINAAFFGIAVAKRLIAVGVAMQEEHAIREAWKAGISAWTGATT